jgi:hypothetical protein
MKNRILVMGFLLTAAMMLFSGCASDDAVSDSSKGGNTPVNMKISVVDGSFASADKTAAKSRTTDTDYGTTFTNGDMIGVVVINTVGNSVITANEKYTLTGGKWLNSAGNEYLPYLSTYRYFAYYPYSETAPTLVTTGFTSTSTAADLFSTVISAWDPGTDQSTHALYTAKDLMVSEATVDASTGYTFSMAHQMALMEMDFAQIRWGNNDGKIGYKYRFDSYSPLDMGGGKYRLLVKPSSSVEVAGKVYTSATATNQAWYISETSPAKANYKVYTLGGAAASLTDKWDVNVGDLYYSDGSWSSTYTTTGKTPIGVVVCTTSDYCESGSGYGHALVMALKNCTSATSTYAWRNAQSDAGLDKINTGKKMYNNSKSGYLNTDTIVNNRPRTTMVTYSQDVFPAFYQAVNYSLGTAPQGSTGWFIPSIGQWWKTIEECETYYNTNHSGATITTGLNTDANHTSTGDYIVLLSQASNGATILNYAMQGHSSSVSCDAYSSSSGEYRYWASSEYSTGGAYYLTFQPSTNLALYYGGGKTNTCYVRPFLAF